MRTLPALLLLLLATPASSAILLQSGTGFFVTRTGAIVTNLHVVNYCQRIRIQGEGIAPGLAKLIGRDSTHDLALLKAEGSGFTPLVFTDTPPEVGERMLVLGYPGTTWRSGKPIAHGAEILPSDPRQKEGWSVRFSGSIEQGNSGGPLLDAQGNVAGVIVAKLYVQGENVPQDMKRSGVAIGNEAVKEFLDSHRVAYAKKKTGDVRSGVVNVRCETATEVR